MMPGGLTALPAIAWHRQSASSLLQIIALWMSASLVVCVTERSFAADNDQGAQLAATCAACHRLDGHDRGIPSIVGLSEEQFVAVMTAFKSGERSGPIMRPMARALSNEEQLKQFAAQMAAQIPLSRVGQPDEIAKAVVFLASDDSSFVAGAELVVEGGMIAV